MQAVVVTVPLTFPGVLPKKLSEEMTCGAIEFQFDGRDMNNAFQGVQLRAGHEGVDIVEIGEPFPRNLGVAHPRCEPHPGEQAASTLHSQRIDKLLAQQRLGFRMHEEHAMLVQPDLTAFGAKTQPCAQALGLPSHCFAGSQFVLASLCHAIHTVLDQRGIDNC